MRSKANKIAFLGIFTGLAIVLGYLERLLPSPVAAVPGIKLGLANVLVMILLYLRGEKTALGLNAARIAASGLLFSGISGMMYGLAGGLLSFAAMSLSKRCRVFGMIGVSVLGGVCHNVGQIALAVVVVNNRGLLYYMPVLIISGVITGIVTGIVAYYCLYHLRVAAAWTKT